MDLQIRFKTVELNGKIIEYGEVKSLDCKTGLQNEAHRGTYTVISESKGKKREQE